MDSKNVLDVFVARARLVIERVINGHKRGQVVVGLQNVGFEIEVRDKLQRRAREKRKPFRVVVISVNLGTLEVIFVIDEVIHHAVALRSVQSAILIAPSKPDGNIAHKRHFVLVSRCDIFVQRHHYARVRLFGLVKRTGQARTDFADPARRGKRFRLGRYE